MRAIRGERSVGEFAKKLGVSVATLRRAEDGWLPNAGYKDTSVAALAGISGRHWDWGDVEQKSFMQARVGL